MRRRHQCHRLSRRSRYQGYTDAERQYFEHGDASAVIAEEQAASPATQRLAAARQRAERDQERETWNQYKARRDNQLEDLRAQNAGLDERLRMINDGMTPGPDPREIMERNVEVALEMRARQELNDLQGQRAVRDSVERYRQQALMHDAANPAI